jgi:2'-5' RNA ligase
VTWHVTFGGAQALHELVDRYQRALAPLPGLRPVPIQWLHLTVQALGYDDEGERAAEASTSAVVDAVARLRPFEITFGRPVVHGEAVAIEPEPADPLEELWHTIRSAIGEDALPSRSQQRDGLHPHVSIAYGNADVDASPHVAALAGVPDAEAVVPITGVDLIRQTRVLAPEWVYRWTPVTTARLSG